MRLIDQITLYFCRLGVAGLDPKAPGTWGTVIACLLAPYVFLPLNFWLRLALLTVLFFLGAVAATRAEKLLERKDPGEVVIDELVGVWLVLLPFPNPSFFMVLAAFVLFRVFDIAKPWPVKASECWLPAGYGVMIDDVVAGLWALLCLSLLAWMGLS